MARSPSDESPVSVYGATNRAAGPLTGLRVVDLTVARAGPTCVRQLADLGADVVRLSNERKPDLLSGSDAYNLHRDKRSILIDLKDERGREVLLRLVRRADVLVENFRSDVKYRLRIDYETLSSENPRLIYASISGFGQDGPYATRPGVDQIAQGRGGLMSVTGPPGSGPWRAGIAVSDTAAGTFLAQGVIAALYARERSGCGQWVHTSLLESMVNFMDFQAARWLVDGVVAPQEGNHHPTVSPMGTFRARDGSLNIAPALAWEAFARAIDAPELLSDPRFASLESRVQHREALSELIESKLAERNVSDWVERINAAGVPCGPILSLDQVFEDPQVRHLNLTRTVEHERDGPLRLLRSALTFSETPARIRSAPPVQGAHTREVMEELGYSTAEIEVLIADGAAAERARS